MKSINYVFPFIIIFLSIHHNTAAQTTPDKINFVRQAAQRMIFDENQSIPLAKLEPNQIIGLSAMYPVNHYSKEHSNISLEDNNLIIKSLQNTETSIWFGGFNPFATYSIQLDSTSGNGEIGFEFSDALKTEQIFIKIEFNNSILKDVKIKVQKKSEIIVDTSIAVNFEESKKMKGKIILQMLGSGLTMYLQDEGLPNVIAQSDFNTYIDVRKKEIMNSFQSSLFIKLKKGEVHIKKAEMALTTGIGLADIRAITYEDGEPMLDQGRLWYTMSIRGRALPHHIQGVFSLDPTVFDLKLEGILVFDREDGLLRNEIASHLFYDRKNTIWRGLTTGFSAYANPEKEKKQLLAIESKKDPRFGFSIMKSVPFGIVGDIEDPHILYDGEVHKWRILTCENNDGYKAIILESDYWNKDYKRIAGPVKHNSTGTSIQKIGGKRYCFSGSSEGKIFIYTYPDLKDAGILKMDLPPWDEKSGTRVWPNIVELPDDYPFKYVALMMDRFNYPGLNGQNWSYGGIYLYHGYE